MNILSKVSYTKMHLISTRIELRSTLHVLGLISDRWAEEQNKKDTFKVLNLVKNLNESDRRKLDKYVAKINKKRKKN